MMRPCLVLALLLAVFSFERASLARNAEPRITVRATTPLASEPGDNPGAFTIFRVGDTNAAVTVNFTLAGNATNGVDYQTVPTSVTLAAGQLSTNIDVTPIAESGAAGYKRVVLSLAGGKGAYHDGLSRRATVYIAYNYTNVPPTVKIVTPTNGQSFLSLPNIELSANAWDSNGWVTTVDFYADATYLGTVTNYAFFTGPELAPSFHRNNRWMVPFWPNAREGRFQFVWTNVPSGAYDITAVATDNFGLQTTSDPVSIDVSTNLPTPYVRIVNPVDGANYSSSGTINIYAAAGEQEGVITSVQFLANGSLIGTSSNYLAAEPVSAFRFRQQWLPYYFRWTNAPLGSNTLTAVAIDNNGTTAASSPVTINVTTNSHRGRW